MEKTLRFKIEGKEYKLAFTRETVIATENMGFNLMNIAEKPVKHKGLLDALLDLYNAPIIDLMDEENEKNAIEWTVN